MNEMVMRATLMNAVYGSARHAAPARCLGRARIASPRLTHLGETTFVELIGNFFAVDRILASEVLAPKVLA